MIVGLTGGIASGKSQVSKILKKLDYEIVDADIVAKKISEKSENIEEMKKIFGNDIVNSGVLDRKLIRERAFEDKTKLNELNNLLHPQVLEYFKNKKESLKEDTDGKILIFDVPLLFESHMDRLCDRIMVVSVNYDIQIKRIEVRDGISEELAKKMISSQMSLEDKISRADIVIENNGTLEDLEKRVEKISQDLKEEVNKNKKGSK